MYTICLRNLTENVILLTFSTLYYRIVAWTLSSRNWNTIRCTARHLCRTPYYKQYSVFWQLGSNGNDKYQSYSQYRGVWSVHYWWRHCLSIHISTQHKNQQRVRHQIPGGGGAVLVKERSAWKTLHLASVLWKRTTSVRTLRCLLENFRRHIFTCGQLTAKRATFLIIMFWRVCVGDQQICNTKVQLMEAIMTIFTNLNR